MDSEVEQRLSSLEARVVELERMLADRVKDESKNVFDLTIPDLREHLDRWKDLHGPLARPAFMRIKKRIETLEKENAG